MPPFHLANVAVQLVIMDTMWFDVDDSDDKSAAEDNRHAVNSRISIRREMSGRYERTLG